MSGKQGRLSRWGALRSLREHPVWVAGTLSVLIAVVHQLMLVRWYIEDAAISFTFARNLAGGEGLVAYPGGERVEGYSNPLWTFLMAGPELVGISGFTSSKLFAAVLAGCTVALMVDLLRRTFPLQPTVAILGGLLLAVNPQFAIWGASGLENALFSALLVLGLWLAQRERGGGWPWSALAWAGVALTRPEGIAYAGIVGLWTLATGGRWLAWAATFFVPFGLHQLWRMRYFGWALPNTYYAKLGQDEPKLLQFDRRGWKYVFEWSLRQWQLGMVPLWVAASSTLRGWAVLVPVLLTWMLVMLGAAWVGGLVGEDGLVGVKVWTGTLIASLALAGVAAPIVGRRAAGHPLTGVCLHLLGFGLFFAVYADGDWMKSWRWMSLISVPLTVLSAVGIVELAHGLARWVGRPNTPHRAAQVVAAVFVLMFTVVGFRSTAEFADKPETGPFAIQKRVRYMHHVQRRLHLDHVVNLDVDMGGTMWWSGHEIVDIAGLVDVPMGQHNWEKSFIREYLFDERRPDFAHVHGGWATRLKVRQTSEWREQYLELPPYPTGGRSTHPGNHVAKRHLTAETWEGGREVRFFRLPAPTEPDGVESAAAPAPDLEAPPAHDAPQGTEPTGAPLEVVLHGWRAPAGVAEAGGSLYLEVALSATGIQRAHDSFRLVAFLSWPTREPVLVDVAPGYDWYMPHLWKSGEIVVSRVALPIPEDALSGPVTLGFFVYDSVGLLPAQLWSAGASDDPARVADGEIHWNQALLVQPSAAVVRDAVDQLSVLSELAHMGDCEGAEEAWSTARAFRAHDARWVAANRKTAARSIAACWLADGVRNTNPGLAERDFARARWWDHRVPGYTAATEDLVAQLIASGEDALALKDWPLAYDQLSSAVRLDPRQSRARRLAEKARDERLYLTPGSEDPLQRRRDLLRTQSTP